MGGLKLDPVAGETALHLRSEIEFVRGQVTAAISSGRVSHIASLHKTLAILTATQTRLEDYVVASKDEVKAFAFGVIDKVLAICDERGLPYNATEAKRKIVEAIDASRNQPDDKFRASELHRNRLRRAKLSCESSTEG